MPLMLSSKNSKFSQALTAVLDSEILSLIELEKAVISDDCKVWELYFFYTERLDSEQMLKLEDAVKKIIPNEVNIKLFLEEKKEEKPTAVPISFTPHRVDIQQGEAGTPSSATPHPQQGNTSLQGAPTATTSQSPLPHKRWQKPVRPEETEKIASCGNEPDIYDDVPLPEENCAPPDDADFVLPVDRVAPDITDGIPAPSLSEDVTESAMDRFKKKQLQLQKEAAEQARQFAESVKPKPKASASLSKDGIAIFGKSFVPKEISSICDLTEYSGFVTIEGDVISKEIKEVRDPKKAVFSYAVTDYTSTISLSHYCDKADADELNGVLSGHIMLQGRCYVDNYTNELTIRANSIISAKQAKKTDDAPVKRIEMHLHTKMSQMDGVVDAGQLVKLMMQYGHDTVAVTDHGVVQAFPDMEAAIDKNKANIKLILGMEGYLLDDDPVVMGIDYSTVLSDIKYCAYSIRSTGKSILSDDVFEIGACIWHNGIMEQNTFHALINPHREVDSDILYEASLTQEQLNNAPDAKTVIKSFLAYVGDCVLISHDADDSYPFLRALASKIDINLTTPYIDTLRISREIVQNIKSGKFSKVCDALEIKTGEITDALKEAEITAVIWKKLVEMLNGHKVYNVGELNSAMNVDNGESYHIIFYAKNKKGLFNLYSLVTESHLHHLRRKRPQIPRSSLIAHREGLIVSSACEAGELYRAMLRGVSEDTLEKIASFYDYLEIQPLGNNEFMLRDGIVKSKDDLIALNMKIISLGEKLNKPVLATGDVHYLLPRDAIYRSIIQCAEGYPDADKQAPLYYRTTQEMLDEFYYLDEAKRREVVIDNPRMVADMCEKMESFPRDHLYTPEMDNAEEDLRNMCEKKAHDMYGEVLPDIVAKRLEKELTAIIKHGYAVLYLIAHKVVKKSLSDGYLVGSRGSVGSSFAATMADITEVNPLTPHYLCPKCKYVDFDIDLNKYDCGIDMPHRKCPNCGEELDRLGFNIPFEVFMGFDGDKVPDIDLNFSGVYQPKVHKYIEELFGEKYVFRAGTIGGVADKTAIGYAKKFCEEYGRGRQCMAELLRMADGCIDVKRTTGQHAGGVVILPKKYDINEFTPLQYPANDPSQGIITTHFTFKSLHDTILKADILGHDDPTVIRMLEDLTGIDAKKLPLDDPKVMSIFLSPDALGVTSEQIECPTGTFGIPEFGTGFTIQMLVDTQPKSFSDLIKISGLSHGTDVWLGNAKDLIDKKIATISQCICTREDIMNGLLLMGVENFPAFDTMEKVRKGKGIPEKYMETIKAHDVPQWFVDSCNKIKYMFPKAHAAAYVTMAIRIAWFKVYKPHQYYATYFSVRADDFEVSIAKMKVPEIRKMITEYKEKSNMNPREKGILTMLQITLEMKCRGVEFTDIDIYKSEAMNFTVTENNMIRPPLNAVPGLGETAAISIVEARNEEMFKSQDDLLARTKLLSTLLQALIDCGCLKDLPKSQQMSLFDFGV